MSLSWLEEIAKLSLPSAIGLILGIALITFAKPNTPEGSAFLLIVAVLSCNVIVQFAKLTRRGWRKWRRFKAQRMKNKLVAAASAAPLSASSPDGAMADDPLAR